MTFESLNSVLYVKAVVGACQPGEGPSSKGFLHDCEIFMNLRLAFVSSSSAECDHLQHAGLEVHVEEVLVPLEADQQRVAGVGLAGQGARRPPVVEHRDDPLHLDSGHVGM